MNGKQKGSQFEREVCKKLSLFLSNGERDDLLWRSAMSGGRATIQNKKGKDNKSQEGDISPIDRLGQELTDKFVIECKNYRNLNIVSGMLNQRGELFTFWQTLVKLAKSSDKEPMLIVKQNRLPTLMLTLPRVGFTGRVADFTTWPAAVFLFDQFLKGDNNAIRG